MIIKVKEPQPEEIEQLRPGMIVFCYFRRRGVRSILLTSIRSAGSP
jgi:alanine dehydrogenase